MAPGCERSRPVVAGPGGAYAVALRSMHGGLCPVSCAPSPVSRARARVHVLRVPRFASRAPRPRLPCSVFRVPRSASCTPCPRCPCPRPRPRVPRFASCAPRPAPAAPHPAPVPPSPAPRTPRPCPWLRLLRPADGCPCSAPCLPPPHFGAGPSGFCKPQG